MFFVWKGNPRNTTWQRHLDHKHGGDAHWHYSFNCILFDPTNFVGSILDSFLSHLNHYMDLLQCEITTFMEDIVHNKMRNTYWIQKLLQDWLLDPLNPRNLRSYLRLGTLPTRRSFFAKLLKILYIIACISFTFFTISKIWLTLINTNLTKSMM